MNTLNSTISAKTYVPIKTAGIERVRVDVNGNVGIGTTSPAATLDINGNSSFRGTLDMSNNRIVSVGKLGVGITNPSTELDVSGNVRLTGTLNIGNSIKLTPGTTVTRPTGLSGTLRYNSDNDSYEGYTNGEWVDVGYYSGLPLGAIIADASNIVPSSSFLLCDGSAVSRAVYSDLFTLIGTTYGSGNGTSTFNLPNLKGKTIVGYDPADASFNALGSTGGEKFVTLTLDQIPSHNHAFSGNVAAQFQGNTATTSVMTGHTHTASESSQGHYHNVTPWVTGIHQYKSNIDFWSQNQGLNCIWDQGSGVNTKTSYANFQCEYNGSHSHIATSSGSILIQHTLASQLSGGSNSHNNVQPYIVLNYYIKVSKNPKKYITTICDERIKKNITDLDNELCFEVINAIEPKQYQFINNCKQFNTIYGYIAQDVKTKLLDSVIISKNYIPNVNSKCILKDNIITLLENTTKCIIYEKEININNPILLKLFFDIHNDDNSIYVTCIGIINDTQLLIKEKNMVVNCNNLYVYGQEIDDFHYLNSDAIYTLLVGVLHKLDEKYIEYEKYFTKTINNNEYIITNLNK